MQIVLKGNPLSTQTVYKSTTANGYNRTYMTKRGVDMKESYIWEAKSQYKGKPLTEDLKVKVDFYFGDRRKRDIDNYNKLVLDSMNGIVWEDDVQIQELVLRKFYDKENPRVEIVIV